MESSLKYFGTVEYDISMDDYVLTLPAQLVQDLGWNELTEIEWVVEDGKVILKQIEKEED